MKSSKMDRRTFIQATAFGALAAPMLNVRSAYSQGGAFNWKRFSGQSIEVSLTLSPRGDLLRKHEREFTELTGIKVGSEIVPEQQHRQQAVIQFNSGNPQFDVITISWHVQKRLFGKSKWLVDMKPLLADASLTAPDYDFSDFTAGGLRWAVQGDGRMDTLPLNIDPWMIYWNKELFAAKGLAFPKTFEEIVMAAEKLTDKSAGQYGWVSRGLKNANVPVWTSFMLGHDMDPVNPKTIKLQTTTPEAIAAAEYYKKLNKEFAPPGTVGFNWNESQTSFSQGKIGMWLDGIGFAPPLEDPAKSRVVGKVGYGIMPAGPKARHSATFGDGIGVPVASKKKEAAYLYCQWATSKLMCARLLQSGGGSPCRGSAYSDKDVIAGLKLPREWLTCLQESTAIGRPGLPEISPVTEFRDVFGVGLTNMIGGADAKAELTKATEAFTPVLAKSEA
ncbi:MAG: extracellular solute-binding protein [Alphaproteobacteria bacterium]|nr:extracellular solute-binding protein [Alphaproteobacteria bacterium]